MSTESNPPKRAAARTATAAEVKTASKAQSLDIAQSAETLDLAKDLARFIKDNKLTTQVQGKEFVNVEGWQYAGSRLGIVPIVEHVINVGNETELKYQAKVTLWDLRHSATVGAGFAVCSNKESGKKHYQEFAIMSMAQTRATGKAFRNVLAWIIRAAGYEPTPAEEMDYNTSAPDAGNAGAGARNETPAASSSAAPAACAGSGPSPVESAKLVQGLIARIRGSRSLIELRELWDGDAAPYRVVLQSEKDAAKARIDSENARAARTPVMQISSDAITEPSGRDVRVPWATPNQKDEVTRLLNHPAISRQRKTNVLLGINKFTERPYPDRTDAPAVIAALVREIDEAENGPAGNDWRGKLKAFLLANKAAIGQEDTARLSVVAYSPAANGSELREALVEARELATANTADNAA